MTPEQQAEVDAWRAEWNAAKSVRDAALDAAWALEDEEQRRPAYDAAKAEWATVKAELLEREPRFES